MPPRSRPPGARGEGEHGGDAGHARRFRAHARRPLRLEVTLAGPDGAQARPAMLVDVSIAGAGLEVDGALDVDARVSLAIQTPTLWDPLVVPAVVRWTHPPQGRATGRSRCGLAFAHASPESVLATWEMLATLAYD